MNNPDRRSGYDRRLSERYQVDLDVEWQGAGARQTGSLSDISFEGCFVLSSGDVQDGEPVRIFIPLADGMKVQFEGRVANHVVEIGFGVQFSPLSVPQRELIASLIRTAEQ
jgi:hypothetical protein